MIMKMEASKREREKKSDGRPCDYNFCYFFNICCILMDNYRALPGRTSKRDDKIKRNERVFLLFAIDIYFPFTQPERRKSKVIMQREMSIQFPDEKFPRNY